MPGDAFVELKLACYAELLCYLDDNNLVGQLAKLNLMQRPPNIQYYSSCAALDRSAVGKYYQIL